MFDSLVMHSLWFQTSAWLSDHPLWLAFGPLIAVVLIAAGFIAVHEMSDARRNTHVEPEVEIEPTEYRGSWFI